MNFFRPELGNFIHVQPLIYEKPSSHNPPRHIRLLQPGAKIHCGRHLHRPGRAKPRARRPSPHIDPLTAQIQAQDSIFDDGSIPTTWENAGFNNPADFKRFLSRFKSWVRNDQPDSIAACIRFPLRLYPSSADFKSQYHQIFDPALKTAVDTFRLDRIFRNSQGAMVANGRIWFAPLPEGYRIIAINPQ
ncbi:hypothetical protein WJU16_08645 [Chitinophaga pollutisoli]|uniref:Uncharacterized protein n=1 Tax=Chitinophaga pollutisoli TaxID=3133966 RepID=A0ABZ2YWE7_9BACT